MPRRTQTLFLTAALACWMPLAVGARDESASTSEKLEGVTAVVEDVTADSITVRRAGTATDPKVPRILRLAGGPAVEVSGQGKQGWPELRRGDLVLVSYVKGEPPQVRRINVLPRPTDPLLLAVAGVEPTKPKERTFVGYIKRKDGDELHVMRPAAAPPSQRRAELKIFKRHEGTSVEVLRNSWDDLRKGDRVKITFQKGNPRPADRVQVIWRGGEKPLPPGVATRLYDPEYDESVKDVDGIGETRPVPGVHRAVLPTRKIKIPRQ